MDAASRTNPHLILALGRVVGCWMSSSRRRGLHQEEQMEHRQSRCQHRRGLTGEEFWMHLHVLTQPLGKVVGVGAALVFLQTSRTHAVSRPSQECQFVLMGFKTEASWQCVKANHVTRRVLDLGNTHNAGVRGATPLSRN